MNRSQKKSIFPGVKPQKSTKVALIPCKDYYQNIIVRYGEKRIREREKEKET